MSNNLQAIEHSQQLVIDSRDVAEMVNKRHADLLRDIDKYTEILTNAKLRSLDFFISSTYQDGKGEARPCYLVTRKGCEMVANKMTGEKGVIFTAAYINKFHEMEQATKASLPQLAVSPELQMFKLLYDGMVNQEVKVIALEGKVTALEENAVQSLQIPSLPVSKLEIQVMEHVMRKDRTSTTQIAARFGLSAVAFYRLLNTLGFVVPLNDAKGWELAPEYTGKGVGVSDISITGDSIYGYVSWSPKGREFIEEALKFNGIKPIRRLAPKKKHKKRK